MNILVTLLVPRDQQAIAEQQAAVGAPPLQTGTISKFPVVDPPLSDVTIPLGSFIQRSILYTTDASLGANWPNAQDAALALAQEWASELEATDLVITRPITATGLAF